jgi:peptide/nickel transport system permease protein
VLGEDFVRSARARGLSERLVVGRHALRVACLPVVTYGGLLLGGLLGGSVIVESIFGMPGMGALVVDAIGARDFPVVQGYVLVFGTLVLMVNLAVDVLYVALDPRLRQADRP